jgi:Cu(I)/Ag(I) efflux system membrane fusion protein
MSRLPFTLVFMLLVAAVACQQNSTQPAAAQATKPPLGQGTPAQNLVNAYLTVQARLAADDLGGAKSAFSAVATSSKPSELAVSPELRKRLEQAATSGAAASDIAHARTTFAALSDALLSWLGGQTNPLGDPLTLAHCPMALEGKGSNWLQRGPQLRNPYFGADMLTCGSVEKTLAPGQKL